MGPIVVGVDGSPASVEAAVLGMRLAEQFKTGCHFVHAVPDFWVSVAVADALVDMEAFNREAAGSARESLLSLFKATLPATALEHLEVVIGRPAQVITAAAHRLDAPVIVVGGKHRRGLDRLAGSTVNHLARRHELPLLVSSGAPPAVSRILAAVDLSHAAKPVIDTAEAWADRWGAQLRVLHVVEPAPVVPGVPLPVSDDTLYRSAENLFELSVLPLVARPGTETVLRRGHAAAALVEEAQRWRADLLIVGSHGRGWVDRLLIGSVSERLLHLLPVHTLVVPAAGPHGGSGALSSTEARTVAHAPSVD